MIERLALSGVLCSGKDHVAQLARFAIMGFADPIYVLTRYACGTDDKTVPGVREYMQKVGGWGRGDFPVHSIERFLLVEWMRKNGGRVLEEMDPHNWYGYNVSREHWRTYGRNIDFWVSMLRPRLPLKAGFRVAVTNARYANELATLKSLQFESYLVACAPETQAERIRSRELAASVAVLSDASESFSKLLLEQYREQCPGRIIWNDHPEHAQRPLGSLTVDDFLVLTHSVH